MPGEAGDVRPTLIAAESLRERLADRCLDPNDTIRHRAVEIITEVALASEAKLDLFCDFLEAFTSIPNYQSNKP